ncbi:hypothetical protein DFH06DRAFT_1139044 [Mycena polygramma]|nr:hypothetical protein DFH06DRAFT_1139044 [Mycena polygramma]
MRADLMGRSARNAEAGNVCDAAAYSESDAGGRREVVCAPLSIVDCVHHWEGDAQHWREKPMPAAAGATRMEEEGGDSFVWRGGPPCGVWVCGTRKERDRSRAEVEVEVVARAGYGERGSELVNAVRYAKMRGGHARAEPRGSDGRDLHEDRQGLEAVHDSRCRGVERSWTLLLYAWGTMRVRSPASIVGSVKVAACHEVRSWRTMSCEASNRVGTPCRQRGASDGVMRVGKAILNDCLLNGYLVDRTRIPVTHSLPVLVKTDHIYVKSNKAVVVANGEEIDSEPTGNISSTTPEGLSGRPFFITQAILASPTRRAVVDEAGSRFVSTERGLTTESVEVGVARRTTNQSYPRMHHSKYWMIVTPFLQQIGKRGMANPVGSEVDRARNGMKKKKPSGSEARLSEINSRAKTPADELNIMWLSRSGTADYVWIKWSDESARET